MSEPGEPSSEGMAQSSDDWARIRENFVFRSGMTYLNNGTEGSMPTFVRTRMMEQMERWASSPTHSFIDDPLLDKDQEQNRDLAGRFIDAPMEDVVLTNNTSMGLGTVWNGLSLGKGDVVFTTNLDHAASYGPLMVLQKRRGVEVRKVVIPSPTQSPRQIIERFDAAFKEVKKDRGKGALKAVGFSHVTWKSGLRMPVRALTDWAREHGAVTVVDGAHAPGMIDLDMQALKPDFYACAGHKWVNGPPGTGLLYVRDALKNPHQLYPVLLEAVDEQELAWPVTKLIQRRGNNNAPAFNGLTEVMRFVMAIGMHRVEARVMDLSRMVAEKTVSRWGPGALFGPPVDAEEIRSGINVIVPSSDPKKRFDADSMEAIVARLRGDYGIWVRTVPTPATDPEHPERMATVIRVSTSLFNSEAQIDRLFEALDKIVPTT